MAATLLASTSAFGFAGGLTLFNPIKPAITKVAEISIVGFDQRAASKSLSELTAPIRRIRAAADRLATSIVMIQEVDVAPEVSVPPVFAEIDEQVPLPPPSDWDPNKFVQTLPGITAPLGFFDPAGFCASENGADGAAPEGKVRFYREVEIKHCRIAMLAALGFPVAEQFHPLFSVDAPSFSAFQQTPLQTFWPLVVGGSPWPRSSPSSPSRTPTS